VNQDLNQNDLTKTPTKLEYFRKQIPSVGNSIKLNENSREINESSQPPD
jgi:hypothetical protein